MKAKAKAAAEEVDVLDAYMHQHMLSHGMLLSILGRGDMMSSF